MRPTGRTLSNPTIHMSNFLMLLIAAGGSAGLCSCSTPVHEVRPTGFRPSIVVHEPAGEKGDFIICNDGRVLVFPVSDPKTCD